MEITILLLSLVVCILFVLYLKWRLAVLSLAYFMQTKKYTPPTDEELAACTKWVLSKIFKRKLD